MKTGIFWHNAFSGKSWPIIGDKFRNFPSLLKDVLSLEGIKIFEPKEVSEELLKKVHTENYLKNVKKAWYYMGAALSVGGCVEASERIAKGEIINAIVFTVAAGHHAEPNYAWGGTYLSCIGPSIVNLRENFNIQRFAIVDTDSHHGNGTRAVFKGDHDVLHVCFCDEDLIEDSETKIDVDVGYRTTDDEYLMKVQKEFKTRLEKFKPFMIFHNFGHDTCEGDYGDRGLSTSFFIRLAREVKAFAEEFCNGRYIIITHGGSRSDVAELIFPKIAEILVK